MQITTAEREYLLKLLKLPTEYYGTLAGNPHCSPGNHKAWLMVRDLTNKLQTEIPGEKTSGHHTREPEVPRLSSYSGTLKPRQNAAA